MKTTDRFDFEQQLMLCWSVVDDLKILYELPDTREVDQDEMQNLLLGLHSLYQVKFEKLQTMFEHLVHTKQL